MVEPLEEPSDGARSERFEPADKVDSRGGGDRRSWTRWTGLGGYTGSKLKLFLIRPGLLGTFAAFEPYGGATG